MDLVVSALDAEVPPQSLSYHLDPSAPLGATLDPATGSLHWTPSLGDAGSTHLIVVWVSDDGHPSYSAGLKQTLRIPTFWRESIQRGGSLLPDVVHCHDWETALIPLYLKTAYRNDPSFAKRKSVFTIHNLGYQGHFPPLSMEVAGLSWDLFRPEGIEFYGKVNLERWLKA